MYLQELKISQDALLNLQFGIGGVYASKIERCCVDVENGMLEKKISQTAMLLLQNS
ncbi:hypothetical protein [Acinetobacter bouvetii]|uniref:hypothetical protein n=1 Tax=Acinetobacter bouvetii TaxID=202951 RepID=UPI00036A0B23|nr:hypothetical protein [Acinetobacter bouvetii]